MIIVIAYFSEFLNREGEQRQDKRMNIRFWKRINHEPHERHELLFSNCRETFMLLLISMELKAMSTS